eukprot:9360610-Ditylum_brightwellii.AAC.1
MKVMQEKCSFFLDLQKEGLQDCFPDKWEIDIIKKLMTGWSLSLYSQKVTKEDMRSIASNLFLVNWADRGALVSQKKRRKKLSFIKEVS